MPVRSKIHLCTFKNIVNYERKELKMGDEDRSISEENLEGKFKN